MFERFTEMGNSKAVAVMALLGLCLFSNSCSPHGVDECKAIKNQLRSIHGPISDHVFFTWRNEESPKSTDQIANDIESLLQNDPELKERLCCWIDGKTMVSISAFNNGWLSPSEYDDEPAIWFAVKVDCNGIHGYPAITFTGECILLDSVPDRKTVILP